MSGALLRCSAFVAGRTKAGNHCSDACRGTRKRELRIYTPVGTTDTTRYVRVRAHLFRAYRMGSSRHVLLHIARLGCQRLLVRVRTNQHPQCRNKAVSPWVRAFLAITYRTQGKSMAISNLLRRRYGCLHKSSCHRRCMDCVLGAASYGLLARQKTPNLVCSTPLHLWWASLGPYRRTDGLPGPNRFHFSYSRSQCPLGTTLALASRATPLKMTQVEMLLLIAPAAP